MSTQTRFFGLFLCALVGAFLCYVMYLWLFGYISPAGAAGASVPRAQVCPPLCPTDTPTPTPTDTPTPTPTMVLLTPSPVPTATPTTDEYVARIAQVQYDSFLFNVFGVCLVGGILALTFFRTRN